MITVEIEVARPDWLAALPEARALSREAALAVAGEGAVVILLTDNADVAELNERFRGRAGPTNVLSFPAAPNGSGHLGDIALALGVCQAEAHDHAKPLADHLRHLVVHGLLHLLGYDHEDDGEAKVMESLERDILGSMGIPDPYDDGGQDSYHHEP